MNKLVLGNLIHRPLRSIISAFAVAIEVVMILSIAAVMYGILNGSRSQNEGIGGDMMVHAGASTALINTSSAASDMRVAPILAKLPHVQIVSPTFINFSAGAQLENIFGIDYASYNALRPFQFLDGGPFRNGDDMIIDDLQAAAGKGLHVGDKVKALNHEFTVCGIVEHGKGARKFVPIETMQTLTGNANKATVLYIRTDDAPTADGKKAIQEQVRKEILGVDGLQDWSIQTMEEFLALVTPEHLPGFNIALRVVIGIAVIIGFLVIFQSMYTAVMERTREIGILKSMGASKFTIVSVVLRETGLLAVVGVILGVAATYGLRMAMHKAYPTVSFAVTGDWVARGITIALLGALLGALYPAWKAARKDPIDALSYE